MSDVWTKVVETRQYTNVIYFRNGQEIERVERNDDIAWSADAPVPMTQQEIEDYT